MDASAEATAGKKKSKREWKKIDPGQILDIQSYEDVRKGDGKGKKGDKGKGRGKGEDGEGKGKGKGGGKNYNRQEPSGEASPTAESGAPPAEAPTPAMEGGEQRPPYMPSKGGKGGGKARGKGFKGDDGGKGGKGRGGKGRGFQQGGNLNQGSPTAHGAEAPLPAPAAEEARPAPPPQAPAGGNSFPGMPGGFMQQPMAGCMACPMPFFDMSQVSMYPSYMGGCMPYAMPYNMNQEMMPCMGGGAAPAQNSEQRAEQVTKAKTQIEYYFSEDNLIKDVFLRQNIMDTQGWVPMNRLIEFPKLAKNFNDMSILVDAVAQSNQLELKTDASAVRLKNTWSRWVLQRN